MKRIWKTLNELFSSSRKKEKRLEKWKVPSTDEILMGVYKRALQAAANGMSIKTCSESEHLKTDDLIQKVEQHHSEEIAQYDEHIAEDSALFEDMQNNSKEYIEREIDKMPASKLKKMRKLDAKIMLLKQSITDFTLELNLLTSKS